MDTLLLVTLCIPFAASLFIAAWGKSTVQLRWLALVAALVMNVLAFVIALNAPTGNGGLLSAAPDFFGTEIRLPTTQMGLDVRFSVALDGIGLWLFVLTSVLLFTSVLISWEAITERPALYYSMLLLLAGGCQGVFAARDLILFYIFFEFTLIPLFFLIGIWGSEERWYAAVKFFLFTLAGSVLTFLGLLAIALWDYKTSGTLRFGLRQLVATLREHPLPEEWQRWVFLALFAGFAVKVPLVPLHTWLPLAHVQAPAAGSVFLAGILLKIGTYGFLQICLPLLPQASAEMLPWMLWLSVIGIVYGALVCLVQHDIKRLIAYSSISHLGFCVLGIFALNPLGVYGGTLQMINHGISTGALFALVGMLYERYHTRRMAEMQGLSRRLPWLAFFMVFFSLSSIGLPGLNGFAGEFLILTGMFQRGFAQTTGTYALALRGIAVLSVSGVVLGAWYMLSMVQRVFFGPLKEPLQHLHGTEAQRGPRDLTRREILALSPLAVAALLIGLYPQFFLDRMAQGVRYAAQPAMEHADRFLGPVEQRAETRPQPTDTWNHASMVYSQLNREEIKRVE